MPKRSSRENPKDRKASEDMTDNGPPDKKKRRTKKSVDGDTTVLVSDAPKRKRKQPEEKEEILWVDDDTLADSDSDDSEYFPEETAPVSVNIHIHKEPQDKKEDDAAFLYYLIDKYGKGLPSDEESFEDSSSSSDEEDETKKKKNTPKIPIKLNHTEKKYFNALKPKKQKDLMNVMERISKLSGEDGDVPYKFKVLDMPISDYMKSHVIKKINMLSEMSGDSSESYKLKNWVDGLLRIPFGKVIPLPVCIEDGTEKCNKFMIESKNIMNESIYGMQNAKLQIMQIIAQWIVNPNAVGNVIALKGPMGVGKTSFAKNAIAKVLNRPFQFFSLGGASDISNFVGHSYTYEGSIWGRIADCLMHSGTMNPVLYFDEVDKISTTPHGEEITSMLIHLTDRSQNSQFHDRYFSGIEFDLSQCLFIFSLNDIEKVHPILRDRMTIIQCDGYNEKDKKEILKGYVWPQLLERLKFTEKDLILTDEAMHLMIHNFSNEEKGVRTLIRTTESLITRLNMLRVSYDESMKAYPFYMDVQFPLVIDEKVIKILLDDLNPKEPETWVHMYS